MQEDFNRLEIPDQLLGALDRQVLLELFKACFPDCSGEDIARMSRRELITRIQTERAYAGHRPSCIIDDYPLRRPNFGAVKPGLLVREPGQSVYWCRQAKPLESAAALGQVDQNYLWNLPETMQAGDLILTALESTPALVASLEIASSEEPGKLTFTALATFTDPISVADIESMIGEKLPRRSRYLDDPLADKILDGIRELLQRPRPIFVTAGACSPSKPAKANRVLGVAAILQRSAPGQPLACEICERDISVRPQIHLPQVHQDGLRWEIQDHVDELVLLCGDCHQMAHQPTLQQLRNYAKPACPACGERNPRKVIWGMPSFGPDDDEFVTAGCMMPFGPPSQWECRACETQYLVAEFDDRPHQAWAIYGQNLQR